MSFFIDFFIKEYQELCVISILLDRKDAFPYTPPTIKRLATGGTMAIPSRFTPEMHQDYQDRGYWGKTTFADVWDENARLYPDREAVVDSKTRLTWSQAKVWIDRLALGFLKDGLKKDDVLVVQLPNSVELTLLRVAAEKAGLLCVPALRTLRHREMEYI